MSYELRAMSLKTQMTNDLTTFFNTDEFADTITYIPVDGLPVSITAFFGDQNATLQDPEPPGDSIIIFVKTSEVENPQYKDQFIINSESWYLRKNLSGGSNDGIFELEISRSERRQLYS